MNLLTKVRSYRDIYHPVLVLVSAVCYVLIGYYVPREQFFSFIALYAISLGCAILIYLEADEKKGLQGLLHVSILFRMLFLFSIPELSDDYLRYLWDGYSLRKGFSPIEYQPSRIIEDKLGAPQDVSDYAMATDYLSVYPPVCQYLMWAVTAFVRESTLGQMTVLHVVALLLETATIYCMAHLLKRYQLPVKNVLLYALNPLVIIELSGNLHFEVMLISFSLLTVLFLGQKLYLDAGVALALAISSRLLPLIFLLLIPQRFGKKRTTYTFMSAAFVLLILWMPFDFLILFTRYIDALMMYFHTFEFNGSIYYLLSYLGLKDLDYGILGSLGATLGIASFVSILAYVRIDRTRSYSSFFVACLFTLTIYLLFSTTVHPWHVVPLVAFAIFSRFHYAYLWSMLVPLTYVAYRTGVTEEVPGVIVVEYVALYAFLGYECVKKSQLRGRLQLSFARWKAQEKVSRIMPAIPPDEETLYLGCGGGAVCKIMADKGYRLHPVDVKDKSKFREVIPTLYDGQSLPYVNQFFDHCLILGVLNNCIDPLQVLREAQRVTDKQLIIIENVYTNQRRKRLMQFADSLLSWEFRDHPRNHKKEEDWEEIFKKFGMQIIEKKRYKVMYFIDQVMYRLKPSHSPGAAFKRIPVR